MTLDGETKSDLMEAFQDLHIEVELCLSTLLKSQDNDCIHQLFRAIHSIKGNAGILQQVPIVEFSHEIEEVASAIRTNKFKVTSPVAEVILIAMDRLGDLHQQELYGKQFNHLYIDELKTLLHSLSIASENEASFVAMQILQLLGAGTVNGDIDLFSKPDSLKKNIIHTLPIDTAEGKIFFDLSFFHGLSLQIDSQHEGWSDRSLQLFNWAMKINRLAGSAIDENQLAAAIYMHDIGMSFLPREAWDCQFDNNTQYIDTLKLHPDLGYNFLVRIPDWEEAATIVLQHHEHIDGSGYPNGLKGPEIHAGAKILGILDAFFILTKGRVDASRRHSTIRAVSAVNTRIDTEFEGLWVQCFNHVIREELKAGNV